ncbi:MAG: recombinase family protein [Candidatus Berkelbacteria bacterium]|nr:recombinase family protein [Candidatus Berkelbacteria bacterium]
MNEKITTEDLACIIDQIRNKNSEEVEDTSKFRYAIYCRRSSDDPKRQAHSLPDQIRECKRIAHERNLIIPPNSIFTESQSAKEPDIRPVFRSLLNAIKEGKYDGILSWHPDRLSRNMKEAGEIIDLLDSNIIKDLQFVSFYYERSSSGKMTLGIIFVLAKSYSDNLSSSVLRGMKSRIEAGELKGNYVVHGYFKDKYSYLRPDGINYQLIEQAWKMRFEGKTQQEIADFLNQNNYEKATSIGGVKHQIYKMDKTSISNMLRDPIYAGILVYGSHKAVDLSKIYDFMPILTPNKFLELNKEDKFKNILKQRDRASKGGTIKSDLMRGKVFCAECKQPMHTGISKNRKDSKIQYFYYRCETEGCKAPTKNFRAKLLLDFVYKFLDENRFNSKEAYEQYVIDAKKTSEANFELLDGQQRSLRRQITEQKDKIDSIKDLLIDENDKKLKKVFKQDLTIEMTKLKKLEKELEQVKEAISVNKEAILEYPRFLELFGNLPQIIRQNRDIQWQDFFIKKIFSNFYIKEKIVSQFELNEPFKSMLNPPKVGGGREIRTFIELTFSILSENFGLVKDFNQSLSSFIEEHTPVEAPTFAVKL